MLFYPIKNYEDFKVIFGTRCCDNGATSRKNNILLSLYKSKYALHLLRRALEDYPCDMDEKWEILPTYLNIEDVFAHMKRALCHYEFLKDDAKTNTDTLGCGLFTLADGTQFWTGLFVLDGLKGLCHKSDETCIRFAHKKHPDRFYKMKAGKFCRALLEENYVTRHLPEQIKVAFCEDFAMKWRACASSFGETNYDLHIGNDLEDFRCIYSSRYLEGDFHSCMVDDEQYFFWKKSVKCRAAYLTRHSDGLICARCVIYDEVTDVDTGEKLRLAERQYATDGNDTYKQILVNKLIEGKHIDGYKRVGMGAHDITAFVGVKGEDLSGRRFSISNTLKWFGTLTYQDTFIYYDPRANKAYNFCPQCAVFTLDRCAGTFDPSDHPTEYSSYHEDYVHAENAVWTERHGYVDKICVKVVFAEDTQGYELACECTREDGAWWFNHVPRAEKCAES